MKKRIVIFACTVMAAIMMTGCCLKHDWEDATCKEPQTCAKCGKTQGDKLDHEWNDATCTEPKTCDLCGKTKGDALGHKWSDATCTEPSTCYVCGETNGEAKGHEWSFATCIEERFCYVCGESDHQKGEHDWIEATCYSPKYCYYCGEEEGERLPHKWTGTNTYVYCENCYDDLPENDFVNGQVTWGGVSITLPTNFEQYGTYYETKASFATDIEYVFISTLWFSGVNEANTIEVLEEGIYDDYEVVDSDIYYNADNKKFYRYEVLDGNISGYTVIYYQSDVVVYFQFFSTRFGSDQGMFDDIMDSFNVCY